MEHTQHRSDTHRLNMGYVWMICLVAACGGLLFGYDWVVIGGAKPFYEAYFSITDPAQSGWAMSSALVGCVLGPPSPAGRRIASTARSR